MVEGLAVRRGVTHLVVSVHDVAPVTAEQTRRWCADADSLGIPVSLLVVPGPWRGTSLADEPGYAEVLRARAAHGDELVMHGWSHQAGPEGSLPRRTVGRLVARGAAEFGALDEVQAADRLMSGRAVLREMGLVACGFTPPGWLASPATNRALRQAGFRYTTSHFGVRDLRSGRLWRGFALSHRPGGAGERLGAVLVKEWARWRARRGGLVRIALHPGDLDRPGLRDTTLRAIEAVLAAGGRAMTYSDVVADPVGAH
ncbi:polysaccharide deacetylase family protein [Actinoallomurus vinaceus]